MSNRVHLQLLENYPYGTPLGLVLEWKSIEEQVKEIARFATTTLPALLHTGDYPKANEEVRDIGLVEKRFLRIARFLHRYATDDAVIQAGEVEGHLDDDLLDFRTFTALGEVAYQHYGEADYRTLQYLLAAFVTRYKLESHVETKGRNLCDGLVGSREIFSAMIANSAYLSVEEVALAADMKLESVRNAISRKEMPFEDITGEKKGRGRKPANREKGVPIEEALQWLAGKPGFTWSVAFFVIDDTLPLSGELADAWLETMCDEVEPIYQDRGQHVRTWRVKRSNRLFIVNADGKRKCHLTFPFEPDRTLRSLGLVDVRNRSEESTSRFHDRGFPGGRPVALWQATVPSIETLIKVLSELQRRTLASV